ncbi:invasion protein [Shigella sonnei]|nr:invasion protein [Shigella sonnei]
MTWELILDGYSESSYSATPRFAAARLPWFNCFIKRRTTDGHRALFQ